MCHKTLFSFSFLNYSKMKKTILGLWVIPTQAAEGSSSTLADLTEGDGGKARG